MTYVEANGISLHYRFDGPTDESVLVFSNALGADLRMWDLQIEAFSSLFRVLRYDSRGHGTSDAPRGAYTIEELGRDLLALIDALDIEQAHICGMSLGGMVACWFAAKHPERLERAVFANTAASIGTAELWNARIEAVRGARMGAVRDAVVARWFTDSFRDHHREVVARATEMLEATPPEGYVGSCLAIRDADLGELVSSIRVPSLVLAAAHDEATPSSDVERLCARIPRSRFVILDGAAHLSNMEQPEKFNETVLGFLSG